MKKQDCTPSKAGAIPKSRLAVLDESVRRILTIKFKCGLFENPYIDLDAVKEAMTNPEKQQLSLKGPNNR